MTVKLYFTLFFRMSCHVVSFKLCLRYIRFASQWLFSKKCSDTCIQENIFIYLTIYAAHRHNITKNTKKCSQTHLHRAFSHISFIVFKNAFLCYFVHILCNFFWQSINMLTMKKHHCLNLDLQYVVKMVVFFKPLCWHELLFVNFCAYCQILIPLWILMLTVVLGLVLD